MNDRQIKCRIKNTEFIKEANKENRVERCLFCGKKNPRLCNSHSVPEFILKNIGGKDGVVNNIYNVLDVCIQKEMLGVGQAGCFKMICQKCDSEAFKSYEDEDLLLEFKEKDSILNEIALKNMLRNMHGMLDQMHILKALYDKTGRKELMLKAYISYRDTEMYFSEMNEIIDNINDSKADDFYVIYKKNFEYVTPLAVQGCFELRFDCLGNVIRIEHGTDSDFLRLLHVAVFPLRNKTLVLVFIRKKCMEEYNVFIEQFMRKSEEEKVEFINYIIFKCTDNFFVSKDIDKSVYTNEFKKICDPTSDVNNILLGKGEENVLYEIRVCPNFLKMRIEKKST